jgi:hypothetical protein
MEKIYNAYIVADFYLKEAILQPQQQLSIDKMVKDHYGVNVIEILKVNGLVEETIPNGIPSIKVTYAGKEHIEKGGYHKLLNLQDIKKEEETSLKMLLENNSGLIGTFGVLNAIILFAASGDFAGKETNGMFFMLGTQILSAAMFILSILVLKEIVNTIPEHSDRKIKAFSFCMYATTLGIIMVFCYKFAVPLLFLLIFLFLVAMSLVLFSREKVIYFIVPWRISITKKDRSRAFTVLILLLVGAVAFLLRNYYPELWAIIHSK